MPMDVPQPQRRELPEENLRELVKHLKTHSAHFRHISKPQPESKASTEVNYLISAPF